MKSASMKYYRYASFRGKIVSSMYVYVPCESSSRNSRLKHLYVLPAIAYSKISVGDSWQLPVELLNSVYRLRAISEMRCAKHARTSFSIEKCRTVHLSSVLQQPNEGTVLFRIHMPIREVKFLTVSCRYTYHNYPPQTAFCRSNSNFNSNFKHPSRRENICVVS